MERSGLTFWDALKSILCNPIVEQLLQYNLYLLRGESIFLFHLFSYYQVHIIRGDSMQKTIGLLLDRMSKTTKCFNSPYKYANYLGASWTFLKKIYCLCI